MKKAVLFASLTLLLLVPFIAYSADIEVRNDGTRYGKFMAIDAQGVDLSGANTRVVTFRAGYRYSEYATGATVAAASDRTVFILTASTNATFTLPTAAAGLEYRFATGSTGAVNLKPQATDTIRYLGLDAGDRLVSSGASGDCVELYGASTIWYVVDMGAAAWTDGGQ